MSANLVATEENPFIFPISDKIKEEVVKEDVSGDVMGGLTRYRL